MMQSHQHFIKSTGVPLHVEVKYSSYDTVRLKRIEQGDWIDLYADEDVVLQEGDFRLISLGVVIKLPFGYEAHIAPRSSTYKNFGVLQANGVGVVDESYCGPNDVWKFPAIAMRETEIKRGDKICQFRLMKKMESVAFIEVSEMTSPDRGGFGSTGKQ